MVPDISRSRKRGRTSSTLSKLEMDAQKCRTLIFFHAQQPTKHPYTFYISMIHSVFLMNILSLSQ